jgi:hypothetical protein
LTAPIWVRLDASYDSNAKIVSAGFFASTIHLFLIRVAKAQGLQGLVPAAYCSPEYLDSQLRLSADLGDRELALRLLRGGLERAKERGLLHDAEGGMEIHDYYEYQTYHTAAERQRRHRERQAAGQQRLPAPPDPPTDLQDIPRVPRLPSVTPVTRVTRDRPQNDATVRNDRTDVPSRVTPRYVTPVTRDNRDMSSAEVQLLSIEEYTREAVQLYQRNEKGQVDERFLEEMEQSRIGIFRFLLERGVKTEQRRATAIRLWLKYLMDPDPFLSQRHHPPKLVLECERLTKYFSEVG